MKNVFLKFSFLGVVYFGASCGFIQKGRVIRVPDYRDTQLPASEPSNHKPGDVVIYRCQFISEGYKAVIFSDNTGILIDYEGFYGSEELFDKARYYWTNDSTVHFKLFNSRTRRSITFELSGKGNATSMQVND